MPITDVYITMEIYFKVSMMISLADALFKIDLYFLCLPKVLDSIYFSRRFHVRCVAKAVDKAGHVGTPLRSNIVTIGTDSAICHTPIVAGTARGFQAQSFIATLKYLDVKHKEHPNRYVNCS